MYFTRFAIVAIALAIVTTACSSTPAAAPTTAPAAAPTTAPTSAATSPTAAAATSPAAATTPTTAATTSATSPTAAATTPAAGATAATTPAAGATAATSAGTTTVQFATDAKLGKILTDGKGMTLYQFARDKKDTSACTGQCETLWPPLAASAAPDAPAGDSGTMGLITRTDGIKQVTYNGLPLYYFSKDTKPGDTTGQGFGNGAWKVVQPGNTAPAS